MTCLAFTIGQWAGLVDLQPGQSLPKQLVGGALSVPIFGLGAILCYENNSFTFDLAGRQLVWSKWRLLRPEGGTMPLADIESVVVERCRASRSSSSHRMVLVTKQGKIPLSNAYLGTIDAVNERLANELQALLGTAADVDENSLRAIVRAGRWIDAIAFARERYGFSLADAHSLIESIQAELAKA